MFIAYFRHRFWTMNLSTLQIWVIEKMQKNAGLGCGVVES